MLPTIIKVAGIFGVVMTLVPMLVYAERRISARIQNRFGPIMVGPLGLLQPLADMLKFVFKEDFVPSTSEKILYRLAPVMAFMPAAFALAAIPFAAMVNFPDGTVSRLVIFDADVGILFVLAATTLGVHGLSIAGWSSNNKYSQMGGVRASAQLISYEAPMFIALLSVLMTAGTTNFFSIVDNQVEHGWMFWRQPLAFIIFFVCAFAETNRAPFDMPEAEPELVGGYHTEYGGMRFALFFLGEYIAMVNQCAIITLVFLGGWLIPGTDWHTLLGGWMGAIIFFTKVLVLLLFMIQVRWTLPRFRYDQLMTLGWKRLTPLAMLNLAGTAILGVLCVCGKK